MNGAYGVGPLAFERLGEMLAKGFWIAACVGGVLVALWVVKKWSEG